MIPKKIYYIWFGNQKLPRSVKKNIESWRKYNSDFEIQKIDESNFNIKKYKFAYEAYKAEDWAFVSDVARLDILYKNGGFYFDTDVELIKSIDSLRKYRNIWALENSDAIAPGLVIGCEKNSNIISDLLDIYKKKTFSHINRNHLVTVPIVTNYFAEQGFKRKNKYQVLKNGAHIFPVDYFAPLHYWGGGKVTCNTIAIHHYQGSWSDKKWKKYDYLWLKKELVLICPSLFFTLKRCLDKIRSL